MGPFGNPQQRHLQHHAQGLGSTNLVSSSVNAHLAFGTSDANLNLFPPVGGPNLNHYANGFGGIGGGGTGLGSHAAQMGFAHGAALQRQEVGDSNGSLQSDWKGMMKGRIRDVWRGNLVQEMAVIRALIEKYPYVSMVSRRISLSKPDQHFAVTLFST